MASTFGSPVYGANGAIATPHYLASLAGAEALRDGGSAVDAAIAANLVLTVVWPHMCGPGGDLFAQVHQDGLFALNASGRAGAEMTVAAYRERGVESMPVRGPLAVTVPGAVSGWFALHERWGKLDMARLARDAIRHARDGFRATAFLGEAIRGNAELLARYGGGTTVFGTRAQAGDVVAQPDLATSLETIVRDGPGAMYGGALGERVVSFLRARGGLLAVEDLVSHHADWVEPIGTDYRGVRVTQVPPNSQGVALLKMLDALASADVGSWSVAQRVHECLERKQAAFAYRDAYVADPRAPRGDTIYLCAADRDGMMVSLIQSLYAAWGSGVHVTGTGITLHNRGSGFRLDEAHPNGLAPHKRPLHTLMPGFALRAGEPWLAFGTRGGDGQPQTGLQLLLGLLDLELDLQAAIEAPRWSHNTPGDRFPPDAVVLEARFGQDVAAQLEDRGHQVVVTEPLDMIMGTAQMIQVDRAHGCYVAATDPRGDGVALGI